MSRTDFLGLLQKKPQVATKIAEGLCEEIRTGSRKYTTPLLEQQSKQDVNIPAVSIAAGIESYYRSALNAVLNARLTGGKYIVSWAVMRLIKSVPHLSHLSHHNKPLLS
jgi:hypothetical protein